MSVKIITEKDFWTCSEGAMPAPLQGTRKSLKKKSGDIYITVSDKATASWIDFGCTKSMILDAIIIAAVVIVALCIGVTGGCSSFCHRSCSWCYWWCYWCCRRGAAVWAENVK